jgi:hypothetical protein
MSLLPPRHRTSMRPFAALALAGAVAGAPLCHAQPTVTPALDAAVGLTRAPVDSWRDVRALSPSLALQSPWLSVLAAGDLAAGSSALRGLGWRGTGTASTPSLGRFHLTVSGAVVSARNAALAPSPSVSSEHVRRFAGSGQLAYRRGHGGAWLGVEAFSTPAALPSGPLGGLVDTMPGGAADTTPGAARAANVLRDAHSRLSSGAWRSLGRVVAAIEVRSGITRAPPRAPVTRTLREQVGLTPDTGGLRQPIFGMVPRIVDSGGPGWARRGSDVEARLAWQHGRVALTSIAGLQLLEWRTAANGAPLARVGRRGWAGVDATIALGARMAVIASAGTRPQNHVEAMAAGAAPWGSADHARYATLALRLSPTLFTRPALPPVVRTAAAAFAVQPAGGGRYALRVRVPAARLVELSGDFTGWQPVAMRRATADLWEVVVPIVPGTHHLNIRVDGDAWRAPPGTTTVTDDFNGTVGVIVVPAG